MDHQNVKIFKQCNTYPPFHPLLIDIIFIVAGSDFFQASYTFHGANELADSLASGPSFEFFLSSFLLPPVTRMLMLADMASRPFVRV